MKSKLVHSMFILIGCIFALIMFSTNGQTVVTGDCDVCHGLFPGLIDENVSNQQKQYVLTNILCVNCHSNTGRDTIKILAGSRIPVVYNTTSPTRMLAGGNFFYTTKISGDEKGHNIEGIAPMDSRVNGFPPGYKRSSDLSGIGYSHNKPLTCAGSNGCHGNRNIEKPFDAIRGTHHAVDKPLDGSTIAKSYRYLKNNDREKGITGFEDDEWGQNSTLQKHNEYSSMIDSFCESCHGLFHSEDNKKEFSPWFRHPTGIVLPQRGEYAYYTTYNPDAPVGRIQVPLTPGDHVRPGTDTVMCLSCHRAHAGPYEAGLRWDYDNIFAGEEGKDGCVICHTGK